MYQVLQGAQVVRDGGRIAKKFSGWKDNMFHTMFLVDTMHIVVLVPPCARVRQGWICHCDTLLAIVHLHACYPSATRY